MLFDQREKGYLFFSLFSLISSLEKSRGRVREKWRVKSEEWRVKSEEWRVKSEKIIVKSTKRKSRLRDFSFWLREWDLNLTTFGLWARRASRLLHPAILIWCRKPGSNRYEKKFSRDFKSRASAYSAIPALVRQQKLPHCLIIISLFCINVNTFFWFF